MYVPYLWKYLRYVQNVVWISNLHEIFVQINP